MVQVPKMDSQPALVSEAGVSEAASEPPAGDSEQIKGILGSMYMS